MSVVTAGVGHFQIPTAPAAGASVTSGAANVYTTTAIQLIASTAAALYITGVHAEAAAASAATYKSVQLMIGAGGAETNLGQYLVPMITGSTSVLGFHNIFPPIPVAISQRISVRTADSVGSQATLISLECIAQSNVVDDGKAITTVTTVTNQLTAAQVATGVWQDTTAGDFTTALSVGKSIMNGVALGTGLTVNILSTLPAITANWLTAAGINAAALNGKGDWNIGKTGYALSAAGVQAIWDALTSALTTVGSIGKRIADNLDVVLSTRGTSTYAGTDTAGTTTLLSRLGSPVGASISADVAAVPAATLTAASAAPIAADIKKVKAITVTGLGTAGSPWGP